MKPELRQEFNTCLPTGRSVTSDIPQLTTPLGVEYYF